MKEAIARVSSRGQVVLPADVRESVNISKGTRMIVVVRSGMIIMKPLRKLSELQGILAEMKKESKKVVDELRGEWDIKLEAG